MMFSIVPPFSAVPPAKFASARVKNQLPINETSIKIFNFLRSKSTQRKVKDDAIPLLPSSSEVDFSRRPLPPIPGKSDLVQVNKKSRGMLACRQVFKTCVMSFKKGKEPEYESMYPLYQEIVPIYAPIHTEGLDIDPFPFEGQQPQSIQERQRRELRLQRMAILGLGEEDVIYEKIDSEASEERRGEISSVEQDGASTEQIYDSFGSGGLQSNSELLYDSFGQARAKPFQNEVDEGYASFGLQTAID